MRTLKQVLVIVLCAALCAPIAPARDRQRDAQGAPVTQDVTIIIQQQQVRFVAQKAGQEMHLQIFDQTGELVYDSGAVVNAELIWPLRNGSGEALKSGLYGYKLSVKETGAENARVRRGHFIVDRAADRDGADKLWVTSQSDDKVGIELTAAQTESGTVTGIRLPNTGAAVGGRETPRAIEEEDKAKLKTTSEMLAAALAGTTGRIAKFTSANDVGDSVMTESNGLVDVNASMRLTVAPNSNNNGVISFGTPNTEAGMTITRNAGRADVRFDGSTLKLAAGPAGGPPGPALAINTLGNVGINTIAPRDGYKLHVDGNTLFNIGNGGEIAFGAPNSETGMTIVRAGGRGDLRFEGSTLKLVAGPAGGPPGSTAGVAVTTAGNVGIGTVNPATKLHVEGGGIVETAIKSGNERAILSLGNGLGPSNYVWTLESGVGGRFPSLFGIYNRTVNKSGLEIDGNLLVSVKALQITGGADFAENFDVRTSNHTSGHATGSSESEIQPGMVVAIDPAQPGKLSVSRRAYDRRVAGIISGAGDVKPGMMMRQEGTLADGKHPVALSGRVYVWVDATRGAIRPGDLLTSSATPGHAMKASHAVKAQGAIIGKAMTGLKTGKGLVLVLVTLQ